MKLKNSIINTREEEIDNIKSISKRTNNMLKGRKRVNINNKKNMRTPLIIISKKKRNYYRIMMMRNNGKLFQQNKIKNIYLKKIPKKKKVAVAVDLVEEDHLTEAAEEVSMIIKEVNRKRSLKKELLNKVEVIDKEHTNPQKVMKILIMRIMN